MIHIKRTTEENLAWCGEILGVEFYFKDSDAAALSGAYEPKQTCSKCASKIIECLENLFIDY